MFIQTDFINLGICNATKGRDAKNRIMLLGGRNNDPDFIRSPSDVRNLARLLTNISVRGVIAKRLARKEAAGAIRKFKERTIEQSDDFDDFGFVVKKLRNKDNCLLRNAILKMSAHLF